MHNAIMKATIFTPYRNRWGLPLLFWGMPGTAKTKLIEEICRQYSMPYETLSPSERGEGAFGVVPVPEKIEPKKVKGKASERDLARESLTLLTYPRPDWTEKFFERGHGVVFVDEVTSTPPALQAPLMGLVLERRIGGAVLPPGVRMIAAANPVEIAAGGFDLAAPLANRLGHIDWQPPTVDEHVQFMMRGSSDMNAAQKFSDELAEDLEGEEAPERPEVTFDVASEEARVMKIWPNAWAKAVGLETSFLRARPGFKNKMPQSGDAQTSRAWPSDRTWDFACHAMASGFTHGLSQQERETFVEAFIGAAVASEWFVYMDAQDLPDPAKLLDGKEKFKHDSTRLDRTVAVLQACVTLVVPQTAEKRGDRSDALWGLIEKMTEQKADLDLLVPSVQSLIDANLHSIKVAQKTLATINPVLKKAGVQARRK